jgi:3'(2'), 5'-bisphosphate nucleotidase
LNNLNLKDVIEALIDPFLNAGQIAKEISKKGVKITYKADKSPVTDGDLAVDKALTDKIKTLTPDIPIISEETVNINSININKSFWLIDPIDGTRDYIAKRDEYTLNAGLIIDLKPVAGIIYAPAKSRLFYSYGKNFAFEINNGKKIILSCDRKNRKEIIGLENSGLTPLEVLNIYKKYKVTKTFKMSSSLKFCALASGEVDIYAAKARAFEWDIAAGHAILQHAGGTVTTQTGKDFSYGKEKFMNLDIIAKGKI